jgi:hypothetical protein
MMVFAAKVKFSREQPTKHFRGRERPHSVSHTLRRT